MIEEDETINSENNQVSDETSKRNKIISILITITFVLGPIPLPFDLIWPVIFSWSPFDLTYVFLFFTLVFTVALFYNASIKAREYKKMD